MIGMFSRHLLVSTLGFGLGLTFSGMSGGCIEPTVDHCLQNGGDDYCAQLYPDWDSAYCGKNCTGSKADEGWHEGCTQELPIDCWYCDGENAGPCSVGEGTDTTDTDTTGTATDTSTTETAEETGPQPCVDSTECTNPDAPFCDDLSGECVGCDGTDEPDEACAGLDPSQPICLDGGCVACTQEDLSACGETTPLCDGESNTCVGCDDHSQCPQSACNLAEGNCMTSVVHVDGTEPCADGDGSEASPFCDLKSAFTAVDDETLVILHEIETDPVVYLESNTTQLSIAIMAAPGDAPTITGSQGVPALNVSSSSGQLFLRGIAIVGAQNNGVGVSVNGGAAWIEQCRIVNNDGGGIVVSGGGSLMVENSFVSGTGDDPALDVTEGNFELVYTTVGLPALISVAAVRCVDGGGSEIRNSLVTSTQEAPEVECPGIIISDSALEMAVDDNLALGDVELGWFEDYIASDYHLTAPFPPGITNIAVWRDGDPEVDIDGNVRPNEDGASDFAGADVVP